MPRAESTADAKLSCREWSASCVDVGAVRVYRRAKGEKKSTRFETENKCGSFLQQGILITKMF